MDFLQNLERLMRLYNINRSELARSCNISASTVNSWWNRSCENISLQTLLKLAKFFNCTIEELVNGAAKESYTFDLNEYTFAEVVSFIRFNSLERILSLFLGFNPQLLQLFLCQVESLSVDYDIVFIHDVCSFLQVPFRHLHMQETPIALLLCRRKHTPASHK